MENKNNFKPDEKGILNTNDYPKPVIGNFIIGFIYLIIAMFNVSGIKFHEDLLPKMISSMLVFLCAFFSIDYIKIAWNDIDFNREAKKFLDEKNR